MNNQYQEIIKNTFLRDFNKSSDYRIDLLKEFYSTMRTDTIKWELKEWGLDFLETLERANLNLEYGELNGDISKYKLSNIHPRYFDYMLKTHVEKDSNVCMYYDEKANTVMSFNLDDNNENKFGDKKGYISDELKVGVYVIRKALNFLDIEPLTYVSGRGYHMLVRFDQKIDNKKLDDFAWLIKFKTRRVFEDNNLDYSKITIPTYPKAKNNYSHSLRLFGSFHIKNQLFSHVCSTEFGVLDEKDSWEYFEYHMNKRTVSKEHFEQVYKEEVED